MGKYFSDVVDQAIEDIYYSYDTVRAETAFRNLRRAADQGDGDAAYIYSRCLSGPQYSWAYHPFPEDDAGVEKYVRQSIRQGSAIGVLGAMRCGLLTPDMEKAMPFESLQQAWDAVHEKAQAGSLFCQYMIGNTYFWLDIIRIQGKSGNDFPSKAAMDRYIRSTTLECIPWLEKAFRGGMGFAGRNLRQLYQNGEEGVITPQPAKLAELQKLGAELGYPEYMDEYGAILLKEKQHAQEGLSYLEKAAAMGQLSACYSIGRAYQDGEVVPKNAVKALSYYEKGAQGAQEIGCRNRAGQLYFEGKDGVLQDYEKAVRYLEEAHALDNKWGNDMLGVCYLLGYGCARNPVRAKALFEEVDYTSDLLRYGLGLIYADGMGVPEDIAKGVGYLQKAANYPPAQEALSRFKKTLFGKWVRR